MTDTERRFHDRVRLESRDGGNVVWLVMERGNGSANAFDASMVDAMTDALEALPEAARCLVLRGEGEFSVGADLAAVRETPESERPATLEKLADASNRFIRTLRTLDVPTIAAVNGMAAGGGLGFALACDVVAMHAKAVMDPAYARIGLTPDNSTPYFLTRILGPTRARDLLFAPRAIPAGQAQDLGLTTRVVGGDPEEFDREVADYAGELARFPTQVQVTTRALVDTALTEQLEAHLERQRQAIASAADSPAFTEGLEAFFENREPDWPTDSE